MTAPKTKFIAICTPSLGMVSIEWASALRHLAMPINTGYCECFARDDAGGEIAEGRNFCVATALGHETETREISHLFWIDDDVIVPRMALVRLLSHNADIASGVYFTKSEPSEPLIFPGPCAGTTPFVPDRVFPSWGHGMGLTLIRASVYKRMRDELGLPLDKYGLPEWYRTPGAVAGQTGEGVVFCGGTEDLDFLGRTEQLGYSSIVDTSRACFGWHFDGRANVGYPREQWEQAQALKPIVWNTPEGRVVWEAPK